MGERHRQKLQSPGATVGDLAVGCVAPICGRNFGGDEWNCVAHDAGDSALIRGADEQEMSLTDWCFSYPWYNGPSTPRTGNANRCAFTWSSLGANRRRRFATQASERADEWKVERVDPGWVQALMGELVQA